MHLGQFACLLWVAACYDPRFADGIPCGPNGACPGDQVCDYAKTPPRCVDQLGEPGEHDAGQIAQPADAEEEVGRWQPPVPVDYAPKGLDDDVTLTGDMLELYFNRADDIYVIKRASLADPWSAPGVVTELVTADFESTPEITPDGLSIYFSSDRPGSAGIDIYVATRPSRQSPWGAPVLATGLNSAGTDRCSAPSNDPDVIVLASNRDAGRSFDVFVARRQPGGEWSTPIAIANANTVELDSAPFMFDDGRTLYFFSERDGNAELFQARRNDSAAAFGMVLRLKELNTPADETDPWVSPDGMHLFFARDDVLYETRR